MHLNVSEVSKIIEEIKDCNRFINANQSTRTGVMMAAVGGVMQRKQHLIDRLESTTGLIVDINV